MKKYLFIAAAAVAMLASCSQSDDLSAPVTQQNTEDNAVQFGTYIGKGAGSRAAAYVGDIDDEVLKNNTTGANGFGVLAYYTAQNNYPNSVSKPSPYAASTLKPDFMFNEHVTFDGAKWVYSPIKYWPNDFTTTYEDGQTPPATGNEGKGKLSFFAYAPYMDTFGSTGIIKMNNTATYSDANNQAGNPTITYKMDANGKNVDLLWGTCPDAENYSIAPSGTQSGDYVWKDATDAGKGNAKVNVNLTKQTTSEKVNFLFKHALAKIGGGKKGDATPTGLTIKIDPDEGDNFGDHATAPQTVVTVEYIKIKNNRDDDGGGNRVHSKKQEGTLDLATGFWTTVDGENDFSQDIIIGADANNPEQIELNANIKEQTVNADPDAVINKYWSTDANGLVNGTHKGVTKTEQPVYDAAVAPLLYFPGETPSLDIEIKYIVRTKDPKLVLGYSEIVQVVKKTVTFGRDVEMNKRYNLKIILGMTSVKFEATVAPWDTTYDDDNNESTPNVDTNIEVGLPLNVTGA